MTTKEREGFARATVWIRRDLHVAVKHVATDERISVGECLDRLIAEALEARRSRERSRGGVSGGRRRAAATV